MMGTSGAIIISCLFTVFTLSCAAYPELNTTDDLRNIDFEGSVQKHSLLLLHWFANAVNIDNNNVRLTFNPNSDYGSHYYGNQENLLPRCNNDNGNSQGNQYQYYTVGNINEYRQTNSRLPEYVRAPRFMPYEGNRDRIIFRVQDQNTRTTDRFYITQHHNNFRLGSGYDPQHTYQITTNLLREIQQFSIPRNSKSFLSELRDRFDREIDDNTLKNLRNTWGDKAPLGLLLKIVLRKQNICRRRLRRDLEGLNANVQDLMKFEVVTGENGHAKILWQNVQTNLLKENVAVVLYNKEIRTNTYKVIESRDGCYETSVALSDGLLVKLHKVHSGWFQDDIKEDFCSGREFESPDAVFIPCYDAGLQIFVKDGKACARLYVKMHFTDWKSDFSKSWVGFYESAKDTTKEYKTWQWATKFKQSHDFGEDNTFEYCSSMTVAAGVQARFILKDYTKKADSPPWPTASC